MLRRRWLWGQERIACQCITPEYWWDKNALSNQAWIWASHKIVKVHSIKEDYLHVVVYDTHTTQEMSLPLFKMYPDISMDSTVKGLCKLHRLVLVQPHSSSLLTRMDSLVRIMPVVELAQQVYVKNMAVRLGLTDENGNDVKSLTYTVIHADVLNPLLGICTCCLSLFTFPCQPTVLL